jgi:uncharacterized membrane protein
MKGVIMKKTILGSALMLSGVIGFVGWIIACTNTVESGAWSGVGVLGNLKGADFIISIIFIVISVLGFLVTLRSIKNDN